MDTMREQLVGVKQIYNLSICFRSDLTYVIKYAYT